VLDRATRRGHPAKRCSLPRRVLAGILSASFLFIVATAWLFVWPTDGAPHRVDAVLLTADPHAPVHLAIRLAQTLRAKYLLISLGHDGYGGSCPQPVPHTRLICFDPNPPTTQGEAEYAARLAHRYDWRSILVVSIVPQLWRAEQRVRRCYHGAVYGAAGEIPLSWWPYEIAYQWGATLKMLVLQRNC